MNRNVDVDDSNPVHKLFMIKRTAVKDDDPVKIVAVKTNPVKPKKKAVESRPGWVSKKDQKKVVIHPAAEDENDTTNKEAMERWRAELAIKELDIEKKRQDIELTKLKIAKLRGEVIPTDLVNIIFKQHFKSVTTAFHQGADNFISTITKSLGISRGDGAGLRGELIYIINHAVKDGITERR